jgi:hypothetical protein
MRHLELPPFLFPTTGRDLEDKYIWLSEIESKPKIFEEGTIEDTIINLRSQPMVKEFKSSSFQKIYLYPIISFLLVIASLALIYYQQPWVFSPGFDIWKVITPVQYLFPSIILIAILYNYRERVVVKIPKTINVSFADAQIGDIAIYFPIDSHPFIEDTWDIISRYIYNLNIHLIDNTYLGKSKNFIIEKRNGFIRGIDVLLDSNISKEIGKNNIIVPLENVGISLVNNIPTINVNALYVLSENFFKETKLI